MSKKAPYQKKRPITEVLLGRFKQVPHIPLSRPRLDIGNGWALRSPKEAFIAGDLLLAIIEDGTTPDGWTLYGTFYPDSPSSLTVAYKIANGTEVGDNFEVAAYLPDDAETEL